jgi:hypothetical protein
MQRLGSKKCQEVCKGGAGAQRERGSGVLPPEGDRQRGLIAGNFVSQCL